MKRKTVAIAAGRASSLGQFLEEMLGDVGDVNFFTLPSGEPLLPLIEKGYFFDLYLIGGDSRWHGTSKATQWVERILELHPEAKIIVLLSLMSFPTVQAFHRAGALAVVDEAENPQILLDLVCEALELALNGEV